MRLLIDTVPIRSPGMLQLRTELTQSIDECMPPDCEAVLLWEQGANGFTPVSDNLRVVNVKKPRTDWLGLRKWYGNDLPELARAYQCDAVYPMTGLVTRRLCSAVGVVSTVHNMLPFTPRRRGTISLYSLPARLRNTLLKRAYVTSLKMADAVVVHSQHAIDSVTPFTGEIASKTIVALTGVPRDFQFNPNHPPPHPYQGKDYFLYFSVIRAYKNHLNLIKAYRAALDSQKQLADLLIAGMVKDQRYMQQILTLIREHDLEGRVKYIGILDREAVPAWLHHAEANFYPSLCETNSVVQAEILGAGGVMACSNIPPLSEVGGYAAALFDPLDVSDIARVFEMLSADKNKRQELRRLALKARRRNVLEKMWRRDLASSAACE